MVGISEKEELIVSSASRLFTKYGLKKTTIDDIAKRAGIAKGTVYLYFKSKEDIFRTVARRELRAFMVRLRSLVSAEKTALGQLESFLLARFTHTASLLQTYEMTPEVLFEMHSEAEMREIAAEYYRDERLLIAEMLSYGCQTGEFAVADVERMSLALAMTLDTCDSPWGALAPQFTPTERVGLFLELAVPGLKPRS